MKSRYDLMKQSETTDKRGNNYPDPLSFEIGKPRFTNPLKKSEVLQEYTVRPYMLTYNEYEMCQMDDILYWLNGIGYPFDLEVGETLWIPKLSDFNKFYYDKRVTSR